MGVARACVGDVVKEFGEQSTLADVWAFVDSQMSAATNERAIVLVSDDGQKLGEIWDSSLYYAHWETPSKMRSYFYLCSFDLDTFDPMSMG